MNSPSTRSDDIIDFIFDLFARRGATEYMGEAVTMSQHMEQTAACAVADGAVDSLIIAALLHDLGHFFAEHPLDAVDCGVDNLHEIAGSRYLERYFPPSVTEPIRLHVSAKRYLCTVDSDYFARLSGASIDSLGVQGGLMSAAEISEFESQPYYSDAVKLRRYDDDGKLAGLTINPVTHYRKQLESLRRE